VETANELKGMMHLGAAQNRPYEALLPMCAE